MSTSRLPVILFVSHIEYPFISCCLLRRLPVVAGGAFTLYAYIGMSVISDSLIVFYSSYSSYRLRGLSANLAARCYVTGYSVDCYCPDISWFHSMSVSCPSGLCLSASLLLVTSQAWLESDVLEPQSGVTAGFRRMFQALGGQDRYPAVPSASLNRLVFV